MCMKNWIKRRHASLALNKPILRAIITACIKIRENIVRVFFVHRIIFFLLHHVSEDGFSHFVLSEIMYMFSYFIKKKKVS